MRHTEQQVSHPTFSVGRLILTRVAAELFTHREARITLSAALCKYSVYHDWDITPRTMVTLNKHNIRLQRYFTDPDSFQYTLRNGEIPYDVGYVSALYRITQKRFVHFVTFFKPKVNTTYGYLRLDSLSSDNHIADMLDNLRMAISSECAAPPVTLSSTAQTGVGPLTAWFQKLPK